MFTLFRTGKKKAYMTADADLQYSIDLPYLEIKARLVHTPPVTSGSIISLGVWCCPHIIRGGKVGSP